MGHSIFCLYPHYGRNGPIWYPQGYYFSAQVTLFFMNMIIKEKRVPFGKKSTICSNTVPQGHRFGTLFSLSAYNFYCGAILMKY